MTKRVLWIASSSLLFLSGIASAQSVRPGLVKALSDVKFEGDDSKCLRYATESGDPDTGPSTAILKAAPKCDVPWHFHTAEEELMVVRGSVVTEMEGMPAATLDAGGFAMMSSKVKHRFSCQSKEECIMFVSFDRKYDIFWVKDSPRPDHPVK